jgi:hypothetical protein
MVDLLLIKDYADQIMQEIPEFTKSLIVMDDSQLNKIISGITTKDGFVLVGFIPSHKLEGKTADDVKTKDRSLWLVLHKVDRDKGLVYLFDKMVSSQALTKKLVKKMLNDSVMTDNTCGLMRMLLVPSLSIDPVWSLAGCDGYEINYELKTNTY